jgi:hypothetical protein
MSRRGGAIIMRFEKEQQNASTLCQNNKRQAAVGAIRTFADRGSRDLPDHPRCLGKHLMHPSLGLLLALLLYAASVATVGLFFKSQLDECRFPRCLLCAMWSIQCATRLQPCSW